MFFENHAQVFYLRQGHELYGDEVQRNNSYDFVVDKQAYRRNDLSPVELCRLVGITYDIGPPKICSLKLGQCLKYIFFYLNIL